MSKKSWTKNKLTSPHDASVTVTLLVSEWKELARTVHGKTLFLTAMSARVMQLACKHTSPAVAITKPRSVWHEASLQLFEIRCELESVVKIRKQASVDSEDFYNV